MRVHSAVDSTSGGLNGTRHLSQLVGKQNGRVGKSGKSDFCFVNYGRNTSRLSLVFLQGRGVSLRRGATFCLRRRSRPRAGPPDGCAFPWARCPFVVPRLPATVDAEAQRLGVAATSSAWVRCSVADFELNAEPRVQPRVLRTFSHCNRRAAAFTPFRIVDSSPFRSGCFCRILLDDILFN